MSFLKGGTTMKNDEAQSFTVVEWVVTYVSLGWAYVMLTNDSIFSNSRNFEMLAEITRKEWVVGVICLCLALIKILGFALKKNRIRWVGLILSTIFWVFVSATFLLSAEGLDFNTGFIAYSAISVMSLWTSKEVISNDRA